MFHLVDLSSLCFVYVSLYFIATGCDSLSSSVFFSERLSFHSGPSSFSRFSSQNSGTGLRQESACCVFFSLSPLLLLWHALPLLNQTRLRWNQVIITSAVSVRRSASFAPGLWKCFETKQRSAGQSGCCRLEITWHQAETQTTQVEFEMDVSSQPDRMRDEQLLTFYSYILGI